MGSASPAMPSQAKGCIITVEDADVRWRADGTAPTSTEGHLLRVDDVMILDSDRKNWRSFLNAIQFIRTGSTDAALKITWTD